MMVQCRPRRMVSMSYIGNVWLYHSMNPINESIGFFWKESLSDPYEFLSEVREVEETDRDDFYYKLLMMLVCVIWNRKNPFPPASSLLASSSKLLWNEHNATRARRSTK